MRESLIIDQDQPQEQPPDTSEPSSERQAELEAAYEQQKALTPDFPDKDV
jgi:hypothetical protein